MTLVSVIIPTLNRPELLKRAITSIYNQTFNDKIEIYIIDSSSNEETKSLCENHPYKENRKLNYIRNNDSNYPIDNYVVGAKYIIGDYSKFLCDDDWLEPSFIEESIKLMEINNASCSVSNINLIKSSSTNQIKINNYYKIFDGEVILNDVYKFILNDKSIPISDSASLMMSSKLKEAFTSALKNIECSKIQYGFDFFINYYSVFDKSKTYFLNQSLVNSWAGDDSLTVNAKLSRVSYCNFFAFLKLIDLFNIDIDQKNLELIENKIAIIKFKSFFSKDLKVLIPEVNYKSKVKLSLLFSNFIKKALIKIKYLIKT